MTLNSNFQLKLSDSSLESKNKALGAIIRQASEVIRQSDIPGELDAFWDETPMSTIEIRKVFGDMERSNFHLHFKNFKAYMLENYDTTIVPFIPWDKWPDIYLRQTVRQFLAYMNRSSDKYDIVL